MRNQNRHKLLKKSDSERLFDILAQHIIPKSDLQWSTPLDLLVAAVLSAQATDKAVNKITPVLWRHCRQPEDYLAFGEENIRECIRTIGLFRNKAKAIMGICRELRDRFDGEVPATREKLMSLPGVGRKTANVILNVVYKQPTLAVDTHVHRVSNRMGLTRTTTPEKTELALLKIVPARHLQHAHHYLVLHGRYTCKARKPECSRCPVADICTFAEKNLPTCDRPAPQTLAGCNSGMNGTTRRDTDYH